MADHNPFAPPPGARPGVVLQRHASAPALPVRGGAPAASGSGAAAPATAPAPGHVRAATAPATAPAGDLQRTMSAAVMTGAAAGATALPPAPMLLSRPVSEHVKEWLTGGPTLDLEAVGGATSGGAEPTRPFQLLRLRAGGGDASSQPQPLGDPAPGDAVELAGGAAAPLRLLSPAYLRRAVAACAWARLEATVPPVASLAHALGHATAPLGLPHFAALARARIAAQVALLPAAAVGGRPLLPPAATAPPSPASGRASSALADLAHVLAVLLRQPPPPQHGAGDALQLALAHWLVVHSEALALAGCWREAVTVLGCLAQWADGPRAAPGGAATVAAAAAASSWSWLAGAPPHGAAADVVARALAAATATPASRIDPAAVGAVLLAASVRCSRILTAAGCAGAASDVYASTREAFARLAARAPEAAAGAASDAELAALTGGSASAQLLAGFPPAAAVPLLRGLQLYHYALHADALGDGALVARLVGEDLSRLPGWADAVNALATDGASAGGDGAQLRLAYYQAAHVLLLVGDRQMSKAQWPGAQLTFERALECARRLVALDAAAPAAGDAAQQPPVYSDAALPTPGDLLMAAVAATAIAFARDGVGAAGAASVPLLEAAVRVDPARFLRPHVAALLARLYDAPVVEAAPQGDAPHAAALDAKSRRLVLAALASRFGVAHATAGA